MGVAGSAGGAVILGLLLACGSPAPAEADPPEPAAPAAPPPPIPVETWRCATHQGIVRYHMTNLELYEGGRFSFRHRLSTEDGGVITDMDGAWKREGEALILTPTSGDRRGWRGDGHRFDHGESAPGFCQWKGPLAGGERRLEITKDDAGRERAQSQEFRTPLFRDPEPIGAHSLVVTAPPPCAEVEVPSPPRDVKCETPVR